MINDRICLRRLTRDQTGDIIDDLSGPISENAPFVAAKSRQGAPRGRADETSSRTVTTSTYKTNTGSAARALVEAREGGGDEAHHHVPWRQSITRLQSA